MVIYLIFLTVFLAIIILFLTHNHKKNQSNFNSTQTKLEQTIALENSRLAKQKQKFEIVDDFKKSIKTSNDELFVKIADMNNSLFKELFDINKNQS